MKVTCTQFQFMDEKRVSSLKNKRTKKVYFMHWLNLFDEQKCDHQLYEKLMKWRLFFAVEWGEK